MTPEPPAPPPALVRLLFDAFDEFERAAEALPAPARSGAGGAETGGRLNAGGWIVAHAAKQQDRYWNAGLQDRERDPWLEGQRVGFGDEPSAPDFAEALAAFRRVRSRAIPALRRLGPGRLGEAVRTPGPGRARSAGELLARSIAHLFVHAGELAAIGSLAGAPDLGAPGRMTHSAGPRSPEGGA